MLNGQRNEMFDWKKGDLNVHLSQCAYCKHNESAEDCNVFGRKPADYALNNDVCPSFDKEQ